MTFQAVRNEQAPMAQLSNHMLGNVKVASSIPTSATAKKKPKNR